MTYSGQEIILMKYCFLAIFSYGFALSLNGQTFQFKSYTLKDGLSNNVVNSVLRDDQGFLWVGTSNGLDRFDGNSFDNFYNDPADTTTIGGNDIQCLFRDKKNRMWVGTNNGISLYHPVTQTFSNYSPDTTVLPAIGISFQALCDDDQDNLWVGTKNDLLIFNPGKKQFSSSGWGRFASSVASARGNRSRVVILGIVKKKKDELWVLTTYGLFSVHASNHVFQYYPYDAVDDFYGAELHYADSRSKVWISVYTGNILSYNASTNKWLSYQTPAKFNARGNAYCVTRYGGDTLMYCLGNSLFFLDAASGTTFYEIKYHPEETASSGRLECRNVVRQENFLWLGTNHGLVKIIPEQSGFHFKTLTSGGDVNRVFLPDFCGDIIFSRNGRAYVQKNKTMISPIRSPLGEKFQCTHQYFVEGRHGDAYLNDDEHLYLYNESKNTATPVILPAKRNPSNSYDIRNVVIDRSGTVWIRTLGQGILTYNPAMSKTYFETTLPVTGQREINALYYDSLTDRLWIAEEFNGVFAYDIHRKSSQHFPLNAASSQRRAAILCITGDGRGNVWMGNLLSGIVEYNYSTKKFASYTSHDGLASDKTSWLSLDAKGYLWICTDVGLSCMDTATKKFTNYYTSEGFPATNESFLSADRSGNMYLPFQSGYYTWNDEELRNHRTDGRIYLRRAELFNTTLPLDSEYHFSYSHNSVQFLFGWLSFAASVPEYIEYRLNNNPWITFNLHSRIAFANLAPGRYDLSIRNRNGPANILHLQFFIKAPFWRQSWFMVLVLLTLSLIVFMAWRKRLNAVRRESSLKHRVMESEMSALRSQMNPHFIFNTLNSINSYIIDNKTQQASDYLTDFGSLIRTVLEHSRRKTISLQEELHALTLYLELEFKRLDESFDYRIEIQPSLDTAAVQVPPLIIQPFVENAIWHGLRNKKDAGNIEIEIRSDGRELQISVTDNGIGREAAAKLQTIKEKRSFGSHATLQRIKLADRDSRILFEDLYDYEGNAAGSRVNIFLPLKHTDHAIT